MLPEAFVVRMGQLLLDETEQFLASYQEGRSLGLRVNTLKVTPAALSLRVPWQLQPVPWCESGFYYTAADQPGKHPYHAAGLYYLQDPSAMAVAEVAAPLPGERVLDLCAAPGGKSTQLLAGLQDRGLLVANELYPGRAKILVENLERWGARNALVTVAEPDELAERFGPYFDCVVVDAPCSGEGMFRKDPAATTYWSERHVAECALLQAGILDAAYRLLAPGGRLLFSTCTFSREENEQNVQAMLERHPDLSLLPARQHESWQPGLASGLAPELTKAVRLWPHRLLGEGHFISLLQKAGQLPDRLERQSPSEVPAGRPPQELVEFARQHLLFLPEGPFRQYGDWLYQLPNVQLPDFSGLRVPRPGWPLGELRKGRFIPSHALALSCRKEQVRQYLDLPSTEPAVERYLHGHTLPADLPDGWTLVTVDGWALGWGKVVSRVLKNHYPKGLRWL